MSVVEMMGGAEVESLLDGCVQIVWNASPQGSSFQLLFAPDAVMVVEERHPVEQALNDSDAQAQAN